MTVGNVLSSMAASNSTAVSFLIYNTGLSITTSASVHLCTAAEPDSSAHLTILSFLLTVRPEVTTVRIAAGRLKCQSLPLIHTRAAVSCVRQRIVAEMDRSPHDTN